MREIDVAAALIRDADGRYLITQRREGSHLAGLWEFPGGKVKPGESLEACLVRELAEELSGRFIVGDRVETIRWEYPETTVILHFFRATLGSGTITPLESQKMAWVEPGRLGDYAFPPADQKLIKRLRATG